MENSKFKESWENLSEEERQKINVKVLEQVHIPATEDMIGLLDTLNPLLKAAIDEQDPEKQKELLNQILKLGEEGRDKLSDAIESRRPNNE